MVDRGQRRHGRSQELRLVDLNGDSTRLLLSGRLGHTQPVWSPTGQRLALTRPGYTNPERTGPPHTPKPGNIWTVTVPTGKTRQLTFINAIKQTPVWSPGGQYLAFVTVAGQIGMVAADQPGLVWRVETDSVHPQFTTIALIP
jgi:Tol biopolymer transport system component